MTTTDFTLHFELQHEPPARPRSPEELDAHEVAFAREQIMILLEFVALFENGRPIRPDSFSIVNAPQKRHVIVPNDPEGK